MNTWYVVTGGPSTGKTTLLAELAQRGYQTTDEVARVYIDEARESGITVHDLRRDEQQFQEEVARRKAAFEATLSPGKTIFFDRGMQDTLAYMRYYQYPLEDWVIDLCRQASYRTVFLLEQLDTYTSDTARIEDESFSKSIEQLLFDAYVEYGMTPVRVPNLGVAERADFVLAHL